MTSRNDDKITIVSDKDSTRAFKVSRLALTSHSTVFRDMLSLADNTNDPVILTESCDEVEALVEALEGMGKGLPASSENWTDQQWESLVAMADKYDIPGFLSLIEAKIWKLEAKAEDAALAFTLAILANRPDLIQQTAKRAVDLSSYELEETRIPPVWKSRVVRWKDHRALRTLSVTSQWKIRGHSIYACDRGQKCVDGEFADALLLATAITKYKSTGNPPLPLVHSLDGLGTYCDKLKDELRRRATEFEAKIANIEYPLDY